MLTGSPISSMNTSPPSTNAAACSTSCTASCDAHEEARHARVGDGDRTAGRDLAGERRDDAAPAAEHVAEAHRAEARRPRGACASTICSPTHFDAPITLAGAHRLVGGDEDEALDADRDGRVDDVGGAEDVGDDRLARVRPRAAARACARRRGTRRRAGTRWNDVEHDVAVADVGEHLHRSARRAPQRVVEVGLVVVEEHEQRGLERGDLAGDLAADRAAAPVMSTVLPPSSAADRLRGRWRPACGRAGPRCAGRERPSTVGSPLTTSLNSRQAP